MGIYVIVWREIRKDVGGANGNFVVLVFSGLIGAILISWRMISYIYIYIYTFTYKHRFIRTCRFRDIQYVHIWCQCFHTALVWPRRSITLLFKNILDFSSVSVKYPKISEEFCKASNFLIIMTPISPFKQQQLLKLPILPYIHLGKTQQAFARGNVSSLDCYLLRLSLNCTKCKEPALLWKYFSTLNAITSISVPAGMKSHRSYHPHFWFWLKK